MSRSAAFPVPVWELYDKLDVEEAEEALAEALAAETPQDVEMVFMANCDVMLAREDGAAYRLTLKHKGQTTAIRLIACSGEDGPEIIAELD